MKEAAPCLETRSQTEVSIAESLTRAALWGSTSPCCASEHLLPLSPALPSPFPELLGPRRTEPQNRIQTLGRSNAVVGCTWGEGTLAREPKGPLGLLVPVALGVGKACRFVSGEEKSPLPQNLKVGLWNDPTWSVQAVTGTIRVCPRSSCTSRWSNRIKSQEFIDTCKLLVWIPPALVKWGGLQDPTRSDRSQEGPLGPGYSLLVLKVAKEMKNQKLLVGTSFCLILKLSLVHL